MIISNVLLIPGTGDSAYEIFRSLRYEKTVRLYAATQSEDNDSPITPQPHRIIPVRSVSKFSDDNFDTILDDIITTSAIDYIVPTTPEAHVHFALYKKPYMVLCAKSKDIHEPFLEEPSTIVDCFSDKNQNLTFVGVRKSQRIEGNTIWYTHPLPEAVNACAHDVNERHQIKGPWRFSYDKNMSITGIQTNFCPEMAIHRALGVNIPLLMVHDARNNPVSALPIIANARLVSQNKAISVDMLFQNAFIDLDDTLIVHGCANDTVIAFIHRCRAKKIPIHLITRHYRDPLVTLREFAIAESLFKTIRWIQDGSPKSSYMADFEKPILLDDAFSERSEVSRDSNIPCLPPDAADALLSALKPV